MIPSPADWRPEDEGTVPPAGKCGVAMDRTAGIAGMKRHDWFCCAKGLDRQQVLGTILKKEHEPA